MCLQTRPNASVFASFEIIHVVFDVMQWLWHFCVFWLCALRERIQLTTCGAAWSFHISLTTHTSQNIPQPHGLQSKTFQPANCIFFCLLCCAAPRCAVCVCVWAEYLMLCCTHCNLNLSSENFSHLWHIIFAMESAERSAQKKKNEEEAWKKNERDNNS